MPALPKAVVIRHGAIWKVVEQTAAWAKRFKRVGQCRYKTKTISLFLGGQASPEQAGTMVHELVHVFWHEADLGKLASEEQVATAFEPLIVAFIRDNPEACRWIAEKARS